jgi:tRNA A-37 threonylcarbamoyl transferase component Bud32
MSPRRVGSYDLVRSIGRGGMGEVWLARHDKLGRAAAVKLIQADRFAEAPALQSEVLRRFEREAQATSSLTSPHAVKVYDFGTCADGTFWYAMELLEGYTLQQLVEEHGAVPPGRAVGIARQLCDVLAEAHARGLVHRDIKPSNVFVCRLGLGGDFVKVVDFGLVKAEKGSGAHDTTLTSDGRVAGSPAYMAPEAVKGGGALDARSDVYAIGCVLHWLLAGHLVFDGQTALEIIVAHATRTPAPLTDVPGDLQAIMLRCLEKTPASRPADAREVGRALAALSVPAFGTAEADAWWNAHEPPGHRIDETVPEAEQAERASRVRSRLERHFEQSRIDVGEYERRLEMVRRGSLDVALDGLPDDEAARVEIVPATPAALASPRDIGDAIVTVLGDSSRVGPWRPPRHLRAVCVLGRLALDFREAELEHGVTVVQCVSVLGDIEIVVPPDMRVEVAGAAVLGAFAQSGSVLGDPMAPRVLDVRGVSVLGNVNVIVAAARQLTERADTASATRPSSP